MTATPSVSQLAVDARRLISAWRSPSTWTALVSAVGAVAAVAWPGISGDVRDVAGGAGAIVVAVWTIVHSADHRHAVSTVAATHKAATTTADPSTAQQTPSLVPPS